ncbi:MAG: hypothetical protein CMC76_12140 [Flavobacteriaceae bacterium]|nr:hypothetical protein [Flavobacteriaceae bacterium]|tara:strand:+ start:3347 stop:3592 length:246 start_codon:yes stop_codon:yes gene_type:complete
MAKNTLSDLNNHLFAQLERLGDEDLTQEDLQKEIERAKAINGVAKNIIDNAKTALEGAQFTYEKLPGNKSMPDQFRIKESN